MIIEHYLFMVIFLKNVIKKKINSFIFYRIGTYTLYVTIIFEYTFGFI
jgi:hypothetical protein